MWLFPPTGHNTFTITAHTVKLMVQFVEVSTFAWICTEMDFCMVVEGLIYAINAMLTYI